VTVLVEAAVDSVDDALAAVEGGADRLELCAELGIGGTTPGEELIAEVLRVVAVPVCVMIRPRGGSFVYSPAELDAMRRSIDIARDAGAEGVVFGVLDPAGRLDAMRTELLVEAAAGLDVTFHRAFDRIADQSDALDELIEMGVARVLTSGGAPTAADGLWPLEDLVEQAAGQIVILAGGGVREDNARELVERTGVTEVHARCERDALRIRGIKRAVTEED
jgi:copper homeostasis protein